MARRTLIRCVVLVACLLALAAAGCHRGDDQPPTKALPASRANFAVHHTYLLQFQVQMTGTISGSEEGKAAYRDDAVAYSSYSLTGDLVGQNGIVEILFTPPDLYFRMRDDSWLVLDPWNLGGNIPIDPNKPIVDYVAVTRTLSATKRLSDDMLGGEAYLHYEGTIAAADLPFASPGAGGPPAPNPSAGAALADVWLHKKSYLPYKLQLTLRSSNGPSAVVTYEFTNYDESQTPPQPPAGARPFRDVMLPAAPCTGDDFALCLQPQTRLQPIASSSCDGQGQRVCLVPLGRISPDLVRHMVDYYKSQYGLTITVLTPSAIPADLVNPLRDQVDASKLSDYMRRLFADASGDPQAVLIGISPVDFYAADDPHLNYIFGVKGSPANPRAVMSTFRMDPAAYSEPTNDDLFFARSRKFLTKYIGLLYYGLPPSSDPLSPLYDSIGGVSDLDNMKDPLPVSAQP